jgi:hypothetical protein
MLVRRPVLMLNIISLLSMVSEALKPVRACWKSVQRMTVIRTSPEAARTFTDIDNNLISLISAMVVSLTLRRGA